MATPFVKPTLIGYDPSPAPDTGQAGGSANIVRWSKHTQEIGDPLRDFAQAIADAVEDAFGGLFGTSEVDLLFAQASAPPGWTQRTSINDRVLRVVSGTGAGTGGSWTVSGLTVAGHSLTVAQLPSHSHLMFRDANANEAVSNHNLNTSTPPTAENTGSSDNNYAMRRHANQANVGKTSDTGSGSAHTHGLSSTGAWRPAFLDVIRCFRSFS